METIKIEMWVYEEFAKTVPEGKTVEEHINDKLREMMNNQAEIVYVRKES